jgi:hypothetical protein
LPKKSTPNKQKIYCSQICGAKCCYVYDENHDVLMQCPNLDSDTKLCKIYKERFEQNIPFCFNGFVIKNGVAHWVSFRCGHIAKDILGKNVLPPEIEKKCCYRKPSLLKVIQ